MQLNAESWRDKLILHLSVSDSGVGIDSSKLADVFQPYEQASGLTALEYGGTGLGLSLCQNLAELMKGQVGVISQPNRGSIFWFDVPVDVMSETTETIDTLPSESLNIAICEDDLTNQRTLQVILTKRGMTVETFNNGRELLDSDGWKKMDVILMDCHMPVLNGMDTTRQLRKQGCTIPVIALTAGVSDTERQLCLDSGMDAVMAKPVDFLLLHEQVLAFVRYGRHPVRTTL